MTPPVNWKRTILTPALTMLLLASFAAWPGIASGAAPVKKVYTATFAPSTVPAGQISTWTLTLTNTNSSNQSFASARVSIPPGWTNVSATNQSAAGGLKTWQTPIVNLATQKIELQSGSGSTSANAITPGQTLTLDITAKAPCSNPGVWTTFVKQSNDFSGNNNDFALSGSQPAVTLSGTCTPNVSVTKTADASSIHQGTAAGFTITVSNTGLGNALGVVATDVLPTDAGLSWTINSGDPGNLCSITAGTLGCNIGTLNAGSSYSVHITSPTTTATVADSPIDNTVSVTATNVNAITPASASIAVDSGVLDCGDTVNASGTDVSLTRLDTTDCVPIDYSLTKVGDHVTFLKDLSVQTDSEFTMSITWDPEAATYPLSRVTKIDFGGPEGLHVVQWCDGSPGSPTLPGTEKVCLTGETPVWLGGGLVQVTSSLYIKGDLLIKH